MEKIIKTIDGIPLELKGDFDFGWLCEFGRVFRVFDQQDSGNIGFGLEKGGRRFFLKFAGAPAACYEGDPEEAVLRIRESARVYEDLKHPVLSSMIGQGDRAGGSYTLFSWEEGECLHAHWDFDRYPKYTHPASPNYRFARLCLDRKLACLDRLFLFHDHVARRGYVAVDFYDGSILYDFDTHRTVVCDIDFYRRGPIVNRWGRMWGSSRFMSPEEFREGALIDGVTNVFTMGATALALLGEEGCPGELYPVAARAVSPDRGDRYPSVGEFYGAWKRAASPYC